MRKAWSIVLQKRTVPLNGRDPQVLLRAINEYFIQAPTKGNPGDPEYANGQVDFAAKSFKVFPIITDYRNRAVPISLHGDVNAPHVTVQFQTPVAVFILPIIFYGVLLHVLLSATWIGLAHITIPVVILVLLFNFRWARMLYQKDVQKHLNFLRKFDL